MRRMFYIALGATAEIAGPKGTRTLAVEKMFQAPSKDGEGSGAQAGGAGDRRSAWWAEVQHFAAVREIELRESLGFDDAHEGGAGQ